MQLGVGAEPGAGPGAGPCAAALSAAQIHQVTLFKTCFSDRNDL